MIPDLKGLTPILLLILVLASGCRSGGVEVRERPIEFGDERKRLSLDYMQDRYGIQQSTPTIKPQMIVVHWTFIPDLETSFQTFYPTRLPSSRDDIQSGGALNVSAHYLVDRDGTPYQLMPDTLMARHVIGLNHCAIGIENVGGTPETPLTRDQLQTNIQLIRELQKKYPIRYVIGHYEYTAFEGHELWKERDSAYRTEKNDPGSAFMAAIRSKLNLKKQLITSPQ